MYSSGIAQGRSSNEAAPSVNSKSESDDALHLARDRAAQLVLVHDAGPHQRLAEAAALLALLHEARRRG